MRLNYSLKDALLKVKNHLKKFIESICLYLSLIAKKPLHPVGMDFGENNSVEEVIDGERVYYCDIKKPLKEKAEEYYTCKYCICKVR